MSHLWWKTFTVDLGVFQNIKAALSGDASRAGTHKPRWNFFSLPKCTRVCVVPALNWSSKKINPTSLPLGLAGPLWRRNRGGYIRASWPTFNCEARQIRSQSTQGLVQMAYSSHVAHQKPVRRLTELRFKLKGVYRCVKGEKLIALWQVRKHLPEKTPMGSNFISYCKIWID